MIGWCMHISPWRSIRILVYAMTKKVHDTFFATTSDTTLSATTGAIYTDFPAHIHQQLNDDIIAIRQGNYQLYRDIRTYTALWPLVWAEIAPMMRSAVLSRANVQPLLDILIDMGNSVRLAVSRGEGE